MTGKNEPEGVIPQHQPNAGGTPAKDDNQNYVMHHRQPTAFERSIKLDYNTETDDILLTRQNTLRKLVGILGMALPLLLYLVLLIDAGFVSPLYSISHYYFTRASGVFIIIVSLLGFFLLIYKGKEPVDFYVSSIAGLFALSLLLFPTNNISDLCQDKDNICSLTILRVSEFRKNFHYISAAIFLTSLAYMSIFLFTKSDKPKAERGMNKRRRNRIYRTTGVIMLLAILVILSNFLGIISDKVFKEFHLTFWMETIAVESFGFSWLVKAEVFLKG